MQRWFMSYVQVYRDGRVQFGHSVRDREERPAVVVAGWNEKYQQKEGFVVILLSFQEVGLDVPDADVLSYGVS